MTHRRPFQPLPFCDSVIRSQQGPGSPGVLRAGASEPEGKRIQIHMRFRCPKIRLLNCEIRPCRGIGQGYEAHQSCFSTSV